MLAELYALGGAATRGNFARKHTETIAALACMGYVSTWDPTAASFGSVWRVTSAGLSHVERRLAAYVGADL